MELELEITSLEDITAVIEYTWAALLPLLRTLPGIGNKKTAYEIVVTAGQLAYAGSYKYVYFVNIAFGGVCIIASCLWGISRNTWIIMLPLLCGKNVSWIKASRWKF
jgi:hypothetical protein